MKNKINETVKKFNLISENDTILIALSGGADSILLAEYLISIREEYNLTLLAAHIEHGIRGEESLADCCFVEEFCRKNNIECHVLHIDAVHEAKRAQKSVEEYSRNRRYEFFETIPCDKIATAHNLSDNVETVLFRLSRGTSLKGICGIPPVRGKIIRPLIELTSMEIRNYLDENSISYRVDSTNADNHYSRNYIRNQIIPMFKMLNSDFEASVSRLIFSASYDEAFLESHMKKQYYAVCSDNRMNIDKLNMLSVSEIKRIIARWLTDNNIEVNDYRINQVYALLGINSRVQLSGNLYAVSSGGCLRIADFNDNHRFSNIFVEKSIVSVNDFLNKCEFKNKKFDFYCDCDKIIGKLSVRERLAGDKITPKGRNCSKSLKKLYNELHIPVEKRKNIPVITDDNGIIGVYGYCAAERVAPDKSTKNILIINIRMEDKL